MDEKRFIIIIILFQEDNIFSTNASLTYGHQIQRHTYMRLKITKMKIIHSMYRAGEVSVHRTFCERAIQPYSLRGGGTICPGSRPADVSARSSRMVIECLLTRSMLIKMFTISWYVHVYVHCIYGQSNFMKSFT